MYNNSKWITTTETFYAQKHFFLSSNKWIQTNNDSWNKLLRF